MNKSLIIFFTLFILCMPLSSEELSIKRIDFTGNEHISEKTLKALLQCSPDPILQKINPFKKASLYHKDLIVFDQEIIKNYYQRNGFLEVNIQQKIEISQNKANITYLINENQAVMTEMIKTQFIFSEDDQRYEVHNQVEEEVKALIKKYEQKIFTDQSISEFSNKIRAIFRTYAYLNVNITPHFQLNADKSKLIIDYRIESNAHSYISDIKLKGLNYVPEQSVNFQISDFEAFDYNETQIEEIKHRLQQLGHFQRISTEVEISDSTGNNSTLNIYLLEKPKRVLKAGVGYGIEDHFRVTADYQKMNFLGNCRILNLSVKSSYLEPWNVNIGSQEPIPIRHSLYSNSSIFFRKENESVYEIERLGFISGFSQMINRQHSYSVYGLLEQNNLRYADSYNSDSLQSVYNKAIIAGNYDFKQQKDNQGVISQLQFNYSSSAFSSPYQYFKSMMIHRWYIPVSQKNTLALKFKAGQLQSFNSDKIIPIEERFFAGGSQSIRGWSRNNISPTNESNEKIGGHSLLEWTVEERIMIISSLEWSLFYDGGNVWKDTIDLEDLKHSVGAGIRYHSPIGVLRLDFAHPLSKDTNTNQIYFQIGYSF